MMDTETKSLWSHILGTALKGKMKGKRLKPVTSVQTTWASWRDAHPQTKLLVKDEEVLGSHYQKYYDNPKKMGIFRAQKIYTRMPGKDLVWGTSWGPHAAAILESAVGKNRTAEFSLGESPAIALRGNDGGVRAFIAETEGQTMKFSIAENGELRDEGTGSLWDTISGTATQGKLKGKKMEELPVSRVYWFAWSSFYPNTIVVERLVNAQ